MGHPWPFLIYREAYESVIAYKYVAVLNNYFVYISGCKSLTVAPVSNEGNDENHTAIQKSSDTVSYKALYQRSCTQNYTKTYRHKQPNALCGALCC
ncbi:hypothetical protein BET10_09660 [Pseudoalteromonas amylolytica]|uniref:Uncharacterized protein n=1 Tax=Pseudoalteromonas amylolytica TaxID=1859457 RepID=A0A1S1MW43_9GAMM|nr:hypothetical protein BFC16_09545 [Pseudoalteromonas sp. JW3]OHU91118.1 hypothetical protein BET10_09660 [Pseudoalteromonas amylolytica]